MTTYRFTLKGRATRSAIGETGTGELLVSGLDRGHARAQAERRIARGVELGGVLCDEIRISRVAKVGRA